MIILSSTGLVHYRTEQVRLQLVNCAWWLDCALAQLLLPAGAFINQRKLQFNNSSSNSVGVLNVTVVAESDTGYQFTDKEIEVPQQIQPLSANQIDSIPLTLHRSKIPPDQYTGAVYLTLQNSRDRLILPLDLSVRTGPLLPLIVLLFGVILGRLFKYMQERGEPQAKALEELYRLQGDITRATLDAQEKQMLASMIANVQALVSHEQLDAATTQMQAIRNRLDILIRLEVLETQLNQQAESFPTDVDEFTVRISKARRLIAQQEDVEAKTLLTQISSDLNNIGSKGSGDSENSGVEATGRGIKEVVRDTDRINHPIAIPANRTGKFQQFLINLSGVSDRVRTETTFWVVRPLLSLILLGGLSAAGMGSLYVENGVTFGARPFADYLGLILWGLSADVASRSLSSLQGAKEENL